LELTVKQVPGNHPVVGGWLEQIGCQDSKGLLGMHQVPTGNDGGITWLVAPPAFGLERAMALEELSNRQRIDHEGLSPRPPRPGQ
jgi:hypothetical protein